MLRMKLRLRLNRFFWVLQKPIRHLGAPCFFSSSGALNSGSPLRVSSEATRKGYPQKDTHTHNLAPRAKQTEPKLNTCACGWVIEGCSESHLRRANLRQNPIARCSESQQTIFPPPKKNRNKNGKKIPQLAKHDNLPLLGTTFPGFNSAKMSFLGSHPFEVKQNKEEAPPIFKEPNSVAHTRDARAGKEKKPRFSSSTRGCWLRVPVLDCC